MNWYERFNAVGVQKQPKKNANGRNARDARQCDKEVKFCTQCRCCWEYATTVKARKIERYKNFPSYGKTKEICPTCIDLGGQYGQSKRTVEHIKKTRLHREIV